MLRCDFGNLEREIERLSEANVAGLHLDVMDGHFVPNLTYGMPLVAAFRRLTSLPLDVHLMIANPGAYVEEFREAGADVITVHVEAVEDPARVIDQIRASGAGVGLAINPDTPLERIEPYLSAIDIALVMSVPAGFGGQSFQPVALERLRILRKLAGADLILEIDGGLSADNLPHAAHAGAELFVVGSAIFGKPNYAAAIAELRGAAAATSKVD